MLDSDTIDCMKKPIKTVPVHARIPEEDIAKVDDAAAEELTSRSNMIARIVREWARRLTSKKRK